MSTHTPDAGPAGAEPQGLPYLRPLRTWAGRGTGQICAACGLPIAAHQIEYEVELPEGSAQRVLRLHFDCHRAWSGEVRRRG